jgi:hypothetical protein
MTEEDNNVMAGEGLHPRRHHRLEPFRDKGPTFVLRQWLNIIFLIGAIAGIVITYSYSRELGIYLFIGASALKFIELSLRMLKL